ncbi:TetR/AcrR family transcriptional regulator [candidate division WOR-3 bacterium]|nr:TetR/AcrR family transcriptional regulator [candidate division WOR-3 bacterium]
MNVQSIEADDKRAAIFTATVELIAEKGFHGAPMSEIAQRAKVSVGTIYHYFKSKDDLIMKLHVDIKTRFAEALLVGDDEGMEPYQRFYNLWRNMVKHLASNPAERAFISQFDNSPYEKTCGTDQHFATFARTVVFIQYGIDNGMLKPLPVIVIMEATLALANAVTRLESIGLTIDDEMLKTTCRMAWDAIASHE